MQPKIATVLVLVAITFTMAAIAQAAEDPGTTEHRASTTFGLELDLLPYFSGGWYASAWAGRNHFRLRAVAASTEIPDWMISGDFTDAEIDAYALLVDYFPRGGLSGWWIAGGLEYWQNTIGHPDEAETGSFDTVMATVGGGYLWHVGRHFYLNPWVAMHLQVTGDDNAGVGDQIYDPNAVIPELSIKLGWRF